MKEGSRKTIFFFSFLSSFPRTVPLLVCSASMTFQSRPRIVSSDPPAESILLLCDFDSRILPEKLVAFVCLLSRTDHPFGILFFDWRRSCSFSSDSVATANMRIVWRKSSFGPLCTTSFRSGPLTPTQGSVLLLLLSSLRSLEPPVEPSFLLFSDPCAGKSEMLLSSPLTLLPLLPSQYRVARLKARRTRA